VAVYSISDKIAFFESIFGRGRISSNGINFDVRCPICAPTDPSKKKLSIRTDNDANHCWVCGFKARSLAPLLRKYGTPSQIATYREKFGGPGVSATLVTGEKVEEKRVELPQDFQLLVTAPTSDPDVKSAWRYIISRGLSERDAWYFKFGISSEQRWKRRIIMPSHDSEGRVNYFTARAIDPARKPKYDTPDVDKNPIVFNEINIDWTKRLTLVEGPFDLTKCPDNSTAILGSDLDERHEVLNKILLNDTPVALALDGDMWDTKTPKIAKKLAEYDVDYVVVDVRAWGDPGSMSKAEFEKALAEASRPTWEDEFSRKLKKAGQVSLRL
jgi:hypothetical protein